MEQEEQYHGKKDFQMMMRRRIGKKNMRERKKTKKKKRQCWMKIKDSTSEPHMHKELAASAEKKGTLRRMLECSAYRKLRQKSDPHR